MSFPLLLMIMMRFIAHSSAKPLVKLHSVQKFPRHATADHMKILHFIRHAQGTHNVQSDYRNPAHIDAPLTPLGKIQCAELQKQLIQQDLTVDCVITSTLTRAIQTAQLSFRHQLDQDRIPLIACEDWRETVNYLCDTRRPLSVLKQEYPGIDFSAITSEHDMIWEKYENQFGSHEHHITHRESDDYEGLAQRSRLAWDFILKRREKSIAIVSHSALFMHMFTRLEGVISFADVQVQETLQNRFNNCEIRSVLIEAAG
jgi:broad specificity phosphatase PhoE